MSAYKINVTVAPLQIVGSLSGFVWEITQDNFTDANNEAAIDGGATSILNGGGNLRAYTDSSKLVRLPLDIIKFETGVAPKVKVCGRSPTMLNGSTVYLEADTLSTSQPASTEPYGSQEVWSDYGFVFNLAKNLLDATGNLPDLTNAGATLTDDGYVFNGTDQYIQTYLSGLVLPTEYTISAVATPLNSAGSHCVLATRGESGVEFASFLGFDSSERGLFRTRGIANINSNTSSENIRTILHGKSLANSNELHVNGELKATVAGTNVADVANTVNRIGSLASRNGDWFNGEIESVRFLPSVMSEERSDAESVNVLTPDVFFDSGAWEPNSNIQISSITDPLPANSSLIIDGSGFEAQGVASKVEQLQGVYTAELAVTSWSDPNVTATSADIESTQLKYGTQVIKLTVDSGAFDVVSIEATPIIDNSYTDLTSIATEGVIVAIPDLEALDQVRYETLGGRLTINPDATFSILPSLPDGSYPVEMRVWDNNDSTWGSIGVQTITISGGIPVEGGGMISTMKSDMITPMITKIIK